MNRQKFKLGFPRNNCADMNQTLYESFQVMEIWSYDAGHMTKMAAMPLYGKNPSKIFYSGTGGSIFTKLGM